MEFDPDPVAVFEPALTQRPIDVPGAAVGCFFPGVIDQAVVGARELIGLPSRASLWEVVWHGRRLGVFYPGQGASRAVASLERVVAAGCRTVIFCGGAGALASGLAMGRVVIPSAALRDEGTSFHYVAPGREIVTDREVVSTLRAVCASREVTPVIGKTWTTNGLFRETRDKVARRRAEGCIMVEAEAAALIAVGRFRGMRVGVFLYAADDLSGAAWQERGWKQAADARQQLVGLAADGAVASGSLT
jgi:uridine phosphorylase